MLLLAFFCYLSCLFFPLAEIDPKDMGTTVLLQVLGTVSEGGEINFSIVCLPLLLLEMISAMISLGTIFLYKNRPLQMKLCTFVIITSVLWYIYLALMFFQVISLQDVEGQMKLSFWTILPVCAIALVIAARIKIHDDEELVRSADRIR